MACPARNRSAKPARPPTRIWRCRPGPPSKIRRNTGIEGFCVKAKLLIVELWGLGDLVIATPFIRAAAEKFEVTLLAKPHAQEMRPRLWPAVEIVPFTAPWTAFRAKYHLWRWPWAKMLRLHRELRAKNF